MSLTLSEGDNEHEEDGNMVFDTKEREEKFGNIAHLS